ncbi:aspartyl-phosphate phosphatase Spo0E family protein [Brevibacillus ginsengisoli]|uniref:aspartyl-phosphate phosphatase Spo0E family protein n=1 Tax=Brevibacillus ginsengisoli TaxID=363854 RepID=UPI003CEEA901
MKGLLVLLDILELQNHSGSAIPDQNTLKQTIHQLKIELNHLVSERGLSDDSVLKLSQLLDTYIVEYQLLNHKAKSRLKG